ncbi:MAG: type II toxin-antitoxin system RelE/ParE family toxin [Lachnospiraceae bacterium]|nr:type II toxin-antitoxin system RelE/ParE family toxin [Lachnospiraceae bacterium]
MQIEYKRKAVKYIESCDRNTQQRLKAAIEKLPFGDIKKLTGLENDYRLRVGDLRVLFTKENDKIIINAVIPRGQAYKKL